MEGIQSTLSTLTLLTPLVLVGFLFFVIYRTQSIFVLLSRVWRVAAGGKAIGDQEIRNYAEDIHSLTYFRFVSNLKVSSLKQARAAISWSKRTNIDLRDAGRCGVYFDAESLEIRDDRIPSKRWRGVLAAAILIMIFLLMSVVVLALVRDVAFLEFKKSGTSFRLSEEGASRYFFYSRLDVETCGRRGDPASLAGTGFDAPEAENLCAFLTDENFKKNLNDMLRDQQKSAWKIALMLFLLFLPLLSWFLQIVATKQLSARLQDLKQLEGASA